MKEGCPYQGRVQFVSKNGGVAQSVDRTRRSTKTFQIPPGPPRTDCTPPLSFSGPTSTVQFRFRKSPHRGCGVLPSTGDSDLGDLPAEPDRVDGRSRRSCQRRCRIRKSRRRRRRHRSKRALSGTRWLRRQADWRVLANPIKALSQSASSNRCAVSFGINPRGPRAGPARGLSARDPAHSAWTAKPTRSAAWSDPAGLLYGIRRNQIPSSHASAEGLCLRRLLQAGRPRSPGLPPQLPTRAVSCIAIFAIGCLCAFHRPPSLAAL